MWLNSIHNLQYITSYIYSVAIPPWVSAVNTDCCYAISKTSSKVLLRLLVYFYHRKLPSVQISVCLYQILHNDPS